MAHCQVFPQALTEMVHAKDNSVPSHISVQYTGPYVTKPVEINHMSSDFIVFALSQLIIKYAST